MSLFLDPILDHFADDLAVDLGSAVTRIWRKGRGLVLTEPSLIATKESGEILAAGERAKALWGWEPGGVRVTAPLRGGAVNNRPAAAAMLEAFFARLPRFLPGRHRRAVLGSPIQATTAERKRVKDLFLGVGIREVYFIDTPLAAAIGAELPIDEPAGQLLVDVGADLTEVVLIAAGAIQHRHTLHIGGAAMDQAVSEHLERTRELRIAPPTAEAVKIALGRCGSTGRCRSLRIRGRNNQDGMAKEAVVDAAEIAAVLRAPLDELLAAIAGAIGKIPTDATVDHLDRSLLLTGGGSMLSGFAGSLAQIIHLPVARAPQPLAGSVLGSSLVLDYLGVLRRLEKLD
jgi:rod shape-determining protein MreB